MCWGGGGGGSDDDTQQRTSTSEEQSDLALFFKLARDFISYKSNLVCWNNFNFILISSTNFTLFGIWFGVLSAGELEYL